MKKKLQSYSSSEIVGAANKNFLVPTSTQLVLDMLIAILLLFFFNVGRLWNYLNQYVLSQEGGLGGVVGNSTLHKIFNTISQSTILQVAFWVCIGSLVYVLIWFLRNIVINILNDVVADSYVHPRGYSRVNYWESIIARKIFFGVSVIVLVFYFFAGWRLLSSLAAQIYTLFGHYYDPPINLLRVASIVVITMAVVHVFMIICHIAVNSWRFIYRDL
jgi:hypothetical protein